MQLQMANLENAEDYAKLAAFKLQQGQQQESMEIAWRGINAVNGRLTPLFNFLGII